MLDSFITKNEIRLTFSWQRELTKTTVFIKYLFGEANIAFIEFSITRWRLKIFTWLFRSYTIFVANLKTSLRYSEV